MVEAQFDILLRTQGIMGVSDLYEAFVKELNRAGVEAKNATAEEEPGAHGDEIVVFMSVVCGAPVLDTPARERIEAALRRLQKVSVKPFSSEIVQSTGT
jgi:hypothetical protein